MPESGTQRIQGHLLDVRPDRLDLRDRPYRPRLVSLPNHYPTQQEIETFLPVYRKHAFILDQGDEGACTGFGLASVVNFLMWSRRWRRQAALGLPIDKKTVDPKGEEIVHVSPRMLYNLARMYDEWQGEDYEGSSCRGAMKGWHRHGVCTEEYWPYLVDGEFAPPKEGWQQDAARRTIGAYYRIDKRSVNDMQSAILETGAIYVSAKLHAGWDIGSSEELPVIQPESRISGGHAFSMIGYTPAGFIVQNSWGEDWGFNGFAVLTYADWVRNSMDAWAMALGVRRDLDDETPIEKSSSVFRLHSEEPPLVPSEWSLKFWEKTEVSLWTDERILPWSAEKAYHHVLVTDNDGRPVQRLIPFEDAAASVEHVCYLSPLEYLQQQEDPKIVIYAHGGLNDEENALERTRIMAPYFDANGVYPIFVAWKTGFLDTLRQILSDRWDGRIAEETAGGILDGLRGVVDWGRDRYDDARDRLNDWADRKREQFSEARDRSIEWACQRFVKPVWTQMKQNANASSWSNRGVSLLAGHLQRLAKDVEGLEIHVIGHSAGSLLLGHLLDLLAAPRTPVKSCTLFAPACTVRFALEHYAAATKSSVLKARDLHCDILSDRRELADSVGPYGKSLLYLVSRALEDYHKTPLLGRDREWNLDESLLDGLFGEDGVDDVLAWREFCNRKKVPAPVVLDGEEVHNGAGPIPSAHGSFDNDIEVMTRVLERIAGKPLSVDVERLVGY